MPIFYKKTLSCGCTIIALTVRKENDTFELGGHSYNYICIVNIRIDEPVI